MPVSREERQARLQCLMRQGQAGHIADLHNNGRCALHRTISQAHHGYAQAIRKEQALRFARGQRDTERLRSEEDARRAWVSMGRPGRRPTRGRARGLFGAEEESAEAVRMAGPYAPHVPPARQARRAVRKAVAAAAAAAAAEEEGGVALLPTPEEPRQFAPQPPAEARIVLRSPPAASAPALQKSLLTSDTPYASLCEPVSAAPRAPSPSMPRPLQTMSFYMPPARKRQRTAAAEALSLPGMGSHHR